MPRIAASALAATTMLLVALTAHAASRHQSFFQDDFERAAPAQKWGIVGNAGFDFGDLAYEGFGNAWVRASNGWSALTANPRSTLPIDEYLLRCRAEAWVRASNNAANVYMSAIDSVTGHVYWETGPLAGPALSSNQDKGYKLVSKTFTVDPKKQPADSHYPNFRIGMWGNGQDAWIQIDNVFFSCSSRDDKFPESKAGKLPPRGPGDIVPCGPPSCGLDFD